MEKWGPAAGGCLVSGKESQRAHTGGMEGCCGHTHTRMHVHAHMRAHGLLVCKGMPGPFSSPLKPQSALPFSTRPDSCQKSAHSPGAHTRHRGSGHQHSTEPKQPPRPGIFPWLWALEIQQGNRESWVLASPSAPAAWGLSQTPSTGPPPAPHYLLPQVW